MTDMPNNEETKQEDLPRIEEVMKNLKDLALDFDSGISEAEEVAQAVFDTGVYEYVIAILENPNDSEAIINYENVIYPVMHEALGHY